MTKRKTAKKPASEKEWSSFDDWWKDYQLALEEACDKRRKRLQKIKSGDLVPFSADDATENRDGR